jgi:hypothetical protein
MFQKTNGAAATRVGNHREEETFLRFARGNEIRGSAGARPLSNRECRFKQLG